jgi:hypothetical protein
MENFEQIEVLTSCLDHAVSASTVYLIRSLGTVWGVSITSAIVQSTLSSKLPTALGDIPDKAAVRLSLRITTRRDRD